MPFPPLAERFERVEETLQLVRQMWSDDDGPFHGRHYHLDETICSPRPVRTPRPPVMVGGSGERKTLRLVARYADACNLFAGPATGPAAVRAKLDVLRQHCTREGTDYDAIAKTILYNARVAPDAEGGPAFVEEMRGYAEAGVSEVHVMPFDADPVGFVEGLGEFVVPALSRI